MQDYIKGQVKGTVLTSEKTVMNFHKRIAIYVLYVKSRVCTLDKMLLPYAIASQTVSVQLQRKYYNTNHYKITRHKASYNTKHKTESKVFYSVLLP